MKNAEILEGNKLIAKFMGLREIGFGENRHFIDAGNRIIAMYYNLKYHTSWDWLMPVVEKIENDDLYRVIIFRGSCDIELIESNSVDSNFETIEKSGMNKNISTWLAVLEFIKWYNENK